MIRYTVGDILLADLPEDVTVAPVSTSSAADPHAVRLREFRQAGLLKPSTVRLLKTTAISRKWLRLFAAWAL